MKTHKLTEWDIGQDLIKCYDLLAEVAHDLTCAQEHELAKIARDAAHNIGKAFNKRHAYKSHKFGLGDGT